MSAQCFYAKIFQNNYYLDIDGLFNFGEGEMNEDLRDQTVGGLGITDSSVVNIRNLHPAPIPQPVPLPRPIQAPQDSSCSSLNIIEHHRTIERIDSTSNVTN